jgi:stage II sporulation protein GA (sporulation sigma-E factor processing peptidase)
MGASEGAVLGHGRGGADMTVYVDEVFFLNAMINFLLLETAVSLTGAPRRRWRIPLGAAFGGLYAVAVLLPGLGSLGAVPGKVLAYLALCAICFCWRGQAWKSWLWFFGVCCGFAGLVLAASALLGTPAALRGGRVYYRVSTRLLLLLAAAVYLSCRLCLDRFAKHRGPELVTLGLEWNGRRADCAALRDNGNTLREPISGKPVCVARWQVAARLLPELGLNRETFARPAEGMQLLRLVCPDLKTTLIPYRAVGTEGGLLLAVRMDRITENGAPSAFHLVAFSATEVSDGGGYEALCHTLN